MRFNFETEGDFKNIIRKLQRLTDSDAQAALRSIGDDGVAALERATPRDTGETAASWDYTVKGTRKGPVMGIMNHGHPGLGVNIAILKQVGHGTGTGGYVPPNDYIRPAMNRTFAKAGELIKKELRD